MRSVTVCLAFAIGGVLSEQVGPDLSGRWNRESGNGMVAATDWGARVEIQQAGPSVTVRPVSGKPEQYWLDGAERAMVLSANGCANKTRITKAAADRDKVTITTWLVDKIGCAHGEDDDDPLIHALGPVEVKKVLGRRTLESIAVLYREGNALIVETTARPVPGAEATTTTSTYRK
jgi:hypothetical protein